MATSQDQGDFNLTTSPSSVTPAPYELPKAMPTPAQNLHLIVDNTQRSWERMHTEIKEQNAAIKELTTSLKNENISQEQFKSLGDQMRTNHRELFTLIKTHHESTESEMDKLVKGMKHMIEEEVKNSAISLLSEVRFMVEQFQMETQQDLKGYHTATEESISKLSETVMAMNKDLNKLTIHMSTVESEREAQIELLDKMNSNLESRLVTFREEAKSAVSSSRSVSPGAVVTTPTSIKSDHIKLTFPTYGGPADDPDPLKNTSFIRC